MNRRYGILESLREKNDFVSGSEIGERFKISRAAVNKHITALRKEGYIIESVPNKGYRLKDSPDIINSEEIKRNLNARIMGSEVLCFDTLSSTNDKAKEAGEKALPSGTVILCENQTGGKGRRGRSWSFAPKEAIAMSIMLRPDFAPEYAANLTLIMGMAVNSALRRVCGAETYIKWPNDIVLGGKKICGILLEMTTEEKDIRYIVCGVGINLQNESFPADIENTATSVYIQTGRRFERQKVVRAVLEDFDRYYLLYQNPENLPALLEEYKKSCINIGREITAIYSDRTIRGKAIDINSAGELVITDENNNKTALRSGEVSVRGVYE